jgi:hypothetical protein
MKRPFLSNLPKAAMCVIFVAPNPEFLDHSQKVARMQMSGAVISSSLGKIGRSRKYQLMAWLGLLGCAGWLGAEPLKTESRTPFLHNIPLHDSEGKVISPPALVSNDGKPQDPKAPPYSPAQTCGKCHDYGVISQGWHFNEAMGNVKPGRPGEPWILTDPATHTQIPLSYRGWKGTFKPSDLGISDYDFLTNFARHFPGGGMGEPDKIDAADPRMGRMQITGKMEIDCMICHQATPVYNHEARFTALKGEDFRWAPSIAEGLGVFGSFRSAGALADRWKPGKSPPATVPQVKYNRQRFDADDNVMFQVTRRPPSENCYYCHTTQTKLEDARWHSDLDVHLRAGMKCADCHRNGLDHMIVRGYEGEAQDRAVTDSAIDQRARLMERDDLTLSPDDARKLARTQLESEAGMIDTLTCAGCHTSGRMGSPRPIHKGMPPIHFKKLTCTACHSGPWPGPQPQIVHTSLAHKLGLPSAAHGENTAPIIVEPVFLNDSTGKIAPYKVCWPSYWARLKDGKLTPILPAEVAESADLPKQKPEAALRDPFNTKPLTDKQIDDALSSLDASKGEPVFIAAGKMYREVKSKLTAGEDAAAAPYAWALAHDVRPARQALGAKGCADCHAGDSTAFFGTVVARGPVAPNAGVSHEMWALRDENKPWIQAFALAFVFRPWLKIVVFAAALVVLAVLTHYGLRGLGAVTAAVSNKKSGP